MNVRSHQGEITHHPNSTVVDDGADRRFTRSTTFTDDGDKPLGIAGSARKGVRGIARGRSDLGGIDALGEVNDENLSRLKLWINSRTRSPEVNTISVIRDTRYPCAAHNEI